MLDLTDAVIAKGRRDHIPGLYRTMVAGAGQSLAQAFAKLGHSTHAQRVVRHPYRNLLGARLPLRPEEGEGYWELTQIDEDIFVVVENFAYKDSRVELVPGDGLVQLYFKLTGDLTMSLGRTEPLRLNRPSLTVYRQPEGIDIDEWIEASARERCVAVTLTPKSFIGNFLDAGNGGFSRLRELLSSSAHRFEYLQIPLSAEMFRLAEKLVENPFSGVLGLVYTESVTMELLCTTVAAFDSLHGTAVEQYSERELNCLERARKFLLTQLSPAPTIRQTARIAGMSETLLKRGFKTVYGETLFDFSVRCRMQHALSLLRDQGVPVSHAARAVGYRHQASFATAFGRHFGLRPTDVRKSYRA